VDDDPKRLTPEPPEPDPPGDRVAADGPVAVVQAYLRSAWAFLRSARVALWTRRVVIAAAVAVGLALIGIALMIRRVEEDLPSTTELRNYHPPQVTRVLARDGTLIGEVFVERRTLVPVEQIPNEMKLAVLAAEDASFYEHQGLNYLGMLRALAVNLRDGRSRQGGSTITQQVIKNMVLTSERTYERKFREVILARRIETEMSKDEILGLYLNHINFGHGRYGVEEASRFYFGKSIRDVTLGQATLLAGLPKGPSLYSPRNDRDRAIQRRAQVVDQMIAKGFCTEAQGDAAKAEPVVLAAEPETLAELAPEVMDQVRATLKQVAGDAAERGGYTVTTTIDPSLQLAARSAVRKNLDEYAKRHKLLAPLAPPPPKKDDAKTKKKKPAAANAAAGPAPFEGTPKIGPKVYNGVVIGADDLKGTLQLRVGTLEGVVDLREAARYNPKNLLPSQFAAVGQVLRVALVSTSPGPAKLHLELGPQGALVAIDVRTREVLAVVGSYEAVRGGLDRATRAQRQPGSTFKPFVYGYALQSRRMTPATLVETSPSAVPLYKIGNYDESGGQTPRRLRDALAQSVNVAAVWTLGQVGPTNVVAFAHAFGIESKLGADLSLALGSYEVTPWELTSAYASFAAGGVHEAPVLVSRIVGPGGVELELPARVPARRVMEEAEAYVLTSLLQEVVATGTGKAARALGRPVAGKTGTSNQAKDAWFAGYSPDVACVVWTGYDDASPLGASEAGARAALPAFVDFMRVAHARRPLADFAVPAGVVHVSIDPASGLRAYEGQTDAVDEIFLAGTEPSEVASPDAGTDAPPGEPGTEAPSADAPDAGEPAAAAPTAPPAPTIPIEGPPPF
jgi:penicillin-binding protein 1A